MAFNILLANRVRECLMYYPNLEIEEKAMFGALAFLVNGKMCVNVSGDELMCRIDPAMQAELAQQQGYKTMVMRGKKLKGYCIVDSSGLAKNEELEYWIKICLDYNPSAAPSKKK